ncbi:MAG: T9SS type A sorting domain-containing protein [candidate division WOR-3 bacterium]|nr:MAG: T9SS type A sorting domain-containing protein [candidate division WOR-3 bacterium]
MLNRVRSALITRTVPAALMLVVQGGFLFAQWESDVRLTNDSDSSYTSNNNAWCVAAHEDTVHVVWYDNRDGNYEIYYKRSEDGGATWGADMRLTNDPGLSCMPSVAVSGSEVHVVWEDDRTQDPEVYHKRSTDGGVTWGSDVLVTTVAGSQGMPSVAVFGGGIHVTWTDVTLMGNSEIYYGCSTDVGTTWGTPFRISNATGFSTSSSIAAHESDIHIAWHDSRFGWWNNEIYYRCSLDGGTTWGLETRLTEDTTFSNVPSIAVSGNNVHVVWEEMRDGNFEIYHKRSTNGGQDWTSDARLTTNTADSHCPSLTASGSNLHVVWQDNRDVNEEIYYKLSNDHGSSWDPDMRLTVEQSVSQNPSVASSGAKVHVVWGDDRDGNWEIYYKRNPTGNTGIEKLAGNAASTIQLTAMPNPFTKLTTVSFGLEHSAERIGLSIYDATGRLVKYFSVSTSYLSNSASVVWDGRDDHDKQMGSGVYFVTLEADDRSVTEKILVVK